MSTIQTGSLPLSPSSGLILADQIASLRRQVEQVRSETITTDMRIQGIAKLFSSTAAPISQINPLTDPAPLPTFAISSMSASSSSASGSLSTENHESVIDPDPLSIFDRSSIPTFETSSMLASARLQSPGVETIEKGGSINCNTTPPFDGLTAGAFTQPQWQRISWSGARSSSASGFLPIENHKSVIDSSALPTFKAKSMPAKKHPCSVCDKGYANKYSLTRHMRTHSNSPPPYQCVDCTKHFIDKYGFNRHLRTHTGEKPYKCTEKSCDRAFADRSNLLQHIKAVHKRIKNRQCSICNQSFARNHQLRAHIEKIHPN